MRREGSVYTSDEAKNYRLVFRLSRDYRKITTTASSECGPYGGVGVYFDGDYLKDTRAKTETQKLLYLQ
ncbi:MAG: hypothetical protein JWR54_2113 [Mucilaginibacter sp.]|nr:hypothetical protein [Mucilaginibacter sp.]